MRGSIPSARSSSHRAAVRRSCQTMARCNGRPVRRSHTTAVSRWFGDPDRGDRVPGVGELGPHLGERLERRRPDLVRVVLDPPRLREVLRELAVRPADGRAVLVDRERPHPRGAGVDRQADAHHSATSDGLTGRPAEHVHELAPDLAITGTELERDLPVGGIPDPHLEERREAARLLQRERRVTLGDEHLVRSQRAPAWGCSEQDQPLVGERDEVPGPGPEEEADPTAALRGPDRAARADVLAAAERRLRGGDDLLAILLPAHGASSDSSDRAEGYRSPRSPSALRRRCGRMDQAPA